MQPFVDVNKRTSRAPQPQIHQRVADAVSTVDEGEGQHTEERELDRPPPHRRRELRRFSLAAMVASPPAGSRNPVTSTKAGTKSAAMTPPAEKRAHQKASSERFI